VSCATPGNCAAGGYYTGTSGSQAFVVTETSTPSWAPAEP
jgi:hypothetical protein